VVAVYDRMLHVAEAQRTSLERPQVIVDDREKRGSAAGAGRREEP
jgi:dsDNA-binding SOS-regulon protein